MLNGRMIIETKRAVREELRDRRPKYAMIYRIDGNLVDIRIGSSPSTLHNIKVVGSTDSLRVGQEVFINWERRAGSLGEVPVVLSDVGNIEGGSAVYSGGGLVPDNVTLYNTAAGVAIKPGGVQIGHLAFDPFSLFADPFTKAGWSTMEDGSIFANRTRISPLGVISLGEGLNLVKLSGSHPSYRIWAGAIEPWDAPFSISKDGSIKASAGTIASWALSAGTITGGNLILDGANGQIRSADYQAGLSGFFLDGNLMEAENARIRGSLYSAVFVRNVISANAGTLGVFKSASKLTQDFTPPSSTGTTHLYCEDDNLSPAGHLFAVNDILTIKDDTTTVRMKVTARTGPANGESDYTVTILSNYTTGHTFTAGIAVIDYGPTGTGFVYISADPGLGASPNISFRTMAQSGTANPTFTEFGRLGNLGGITPGGGSALADPTYGLWFGDNSSYLLYNKTTSTLTIKGTIDATSGSITGTLLITGSGTLQIGNQTGGTYISAANGIRMYGSETTSWLKFHRNIGGYEEIGSIWAYQKTSTTNPQLVIQASNYGTYAGTISLFALANFGVAAAVVLGGGASPFVQLHVNNNTIAVYHNFTPDKFETPGNIYLSGTVYNQHNSAQYYWGASNDMWIQRRTDVGAGNPVFLFRNNVGYAYIGAQNAGWFHFQTNTAGFFFYQQVMGMGQFGRYALFNSVWTTYSGGIFVPYGNNYYEVYSAALADGGEATVDFTGYVPDAAIGVVVSLLINPTSTNTASGNIREYSTSFGGDHLTVRGQVSGQWNENQGFVKTDAAGRCKVRCSGGTGTLKVRLIGYYI